MHSSFARHLWNVGAVKIVDALQSHQHLHPHRSLKESLANVSSEIGFCGGAADLAMSGLRLDPQQSIGRMRSPELAQLAHAIYRHWRTLNPAMQEA